MRSKNERYAISGREGSPRLFARYDAGGIKLAGLDIVLTPNGLNVPFVIDKVVWSAVCSLTDERRMSAWRKRIDEYLTRPEFFDIINELAQILNSPATGKEASTE